MQFMAFLLTRKDWLKRIGSPKSRIDGAEFKHAKVIQDYIYEDFQIIKWKLLLCSHCVRNNTKVIKILTIQICIHFN